MVLTPAAFSQSKTRPFGELPIWQKKKKKPKCGPDLQMFRHDMQVLMKVDRYSTTPFPWDFPER